MMKTRLLNAVLQNQVLYALLKLFKALMYSQLLLENDESIKKVMIIDLDAHQVKYSVFVV